MMEGILTQRVTPILKCVVLFLFIFTAKVLTSRPQDSQDFRNDNQQSKPAHYVRTFTKYHHRRTIQWNNIHDLYWPTVEQPKTKRNIDVNDYWPENEKEYQYSQPKRIKKRSVLNSIYSAQLLAPKIKRSVSTISKEFKEPDTKSFDNTNTDKSSQENKFIASSTSGKVDSNLKNQLTIDKKGKDKVTPTISNVPIVCLYKLNKVAVSVTPSYDDEKNVQSMIENNSHDIGPTSETILPNGEQAVVEHCTDVKATCYALWHRDQEGNITILGQGCWHSSQRDGQNTCDKCTPIDKMLDTRFCCCTRSYCNADFLSLKEETVTIKAESTMDTSNQGPNYSHVLASVILAVAAVVVAVALIRQLYCKRTREKQELSLSGQVEKGDIMGSGPEALATGLLCVDNLTLIEHIGQGKFGSVWRGTLGSTPVAVKLYSNVNAWQKEAAIYALPHLSHPNILKYYGSDTRASLTGGGREQLVVLELCVGTLRTRLKQGPITWMEFATFAHGLAAALAHLHTPSSKPCVVHRDVNSNNVLVTSAGHARLADLGLAQPLHARRERQPSRITEAGTLRYLSPEALEGALDLSGARAALCAVDVFALGLVLWEALWVCSGAHAGAAPAYAPPYHPALPPAPALQHVQVSAAAVGALWVCSGAHAGAAPAYAPPYHPALPPAPALQHVQVSAAAVGALWVCSGAHAGAAPAYAPPYHPALPPAPALQHVQVSAAAVGALWVCSGAHAGAAPAYAPPYHPALPPAPALQHVQVSAAAVGALWVCSGAHAGAAPAYAPPYHPALPPAPALQHVQVSAAAVGALWVCSGAHAGAAPAYAPPYHPALPPAPALQHVQVSAAAVGALWVCSGAHAGAAPAYAPPYHPALPPAPALQHVQVSAAAVGALWVCSGAHAGAAPAYAPPYHPALPPAPALQHVQVSAAAVGALWVCSGAHAGAAPAYAPPYHPALPPAPALQHVQVSAAAVGALWVCSGAHAGAAPAYAPPYHPALPPAPALQHVQVSAAAVGALWVCSGAHAGAAPAYAPPYHPALPPAPALQHVQVSAAAVGALWVCSGAHAGAAPAYAPPYHPALPPAPALQHVQVSAAAVGALWVCSGAHAGAAPAYAPPYHPALPPAPALQHVQVSAAAVGALWVCSGAHAGAAPAYAPPYHPALPPAPALQHVQVSAAAVGALWVCSGAHAGAAPAYAPPYHPALPPAPALQHVQVSAAAVGALWVCSGAHAGAAPAYAPPYHPALPPAPALQHVQVSAAAVGALWVCSGAHAGAAPAYAPPYHPALPPAPALQHVQVSAAAVGALWVCSGAHAGAAPAYAPPYHPALPPAPALQHVQVSAAAVGALWVCSGAHAGAAPAYAPPYHPALPPAPALQHVQVSAAAVGALWVCSGAHAGAAPAYAPPYHPALPPAPALQHVQVSAAAVGALWVCSGAHAGAAPAYAPPYHPALPPAPALQHVQVSAAAVGALWVCSGAHAGAAPAYAPPYHPALPPAPALQHVQVSAAAVGALWVCSGAHAGAAPAYAPPYHPALPPAPALQHVQVSAAAVGALWVCSGAHAGAAPAYAPPYHPALPPAPALQHVQTLVSRNKLRPPLPKGPVPEARALKIATDTCEECWDHDAEARLTAVCVEERMAELKQMLQAQGPVIHDNKLHPNPPEFYAPPEIDKNSNCTIAQSSDASVPLLDRALVGRNACIERNTHNIQTHTVQLIHKSLKDISQEIRPQRIDENCLSVARTHRVIEHDRLNEIRSYQRPLDYVPNDVTTIDERAPKSTNILQEVKVEKPKWGIKKFFERLNKKLDTEVKLVPEATQNGKTKTSIVEKCNNYDRPTDLVLNQERIYHLEGPTLSPPNRTLSPTMMLESDLNRENNVFGFRELPSEVDPKNQGQIFAVIVPKAKAESKTSKSSDDSINKFRNSSQSIKASSESEDSTLKKRLSVDNKNSSGRSSRASINLELQYIQNEPFDSPFDLNSDCSSSEDEHLMLLSENGGSKITMQSIPKDVDKKRYQNEVLKESSQVSDFGFNKYQNKYTNFDNEFSYSNDKENLGLTGDNPVYLAALNGEIDTDIKYDIEPKSPKPNLKTLAIKRQHSLEQVSEIFSSSGDLHLLNPAGRVKTPGDLPVAVRKARRDRALQKGRASESNRLSLYDDRMMFGNSL